MKLINLIGVSVIALASGAAKPADTTKAKVERVAPVLTDVADGIPIPATAKKRGQTSVYGLEKLSVGQSIGVIGKTAKQLQPTIAATNRRFMVDKVDENGAPVFKFNEVKDGAGNVTRIPTQEREKVMGRHFIVADVDPASDPGKATARIWRDA